MRANEQGVTLLEIIFVLIIAGTFVILALRQYQIYQLDADLRQVKANVDTLFQAMSGYYKANCIQNRDYYSGTPLTQGALDPTVSGSNLPPQIPISITQNLVPTYLAQWPVTEVPSIVNDDKGEGYIVQFNLANSPPVWRTITNGNNSVQVGQIYFWNIQVAVQLANPDLATTFQNLLAADCISTLSGTTVLPCNQTTGQGGDYLVWSLSPSNATGQLSTLWPTMPLLLQFKRQYTTDDMRALNDPTFENSQYYLCGG